METVKIEKFLTLADGYGYGSGYGYGYGSGDGSGDGDGSGSGSGYGSGDGYGSGSGYGYGSGSGYGYGYGYGYGDGSGSGSGSGDGIKEFDHQTVYRIDGVPTLLDVVNGSIAKGRILRKDLTTEPCFVVKSDRYFAHGRTLRDAMEALRSKEFEDMPEAERIEAFVKEFPLIDESYDNKALFEWHHHLTGSCQMGREAFVRDRGLSLDGSTTVRDFIRLTENAYGGDVIRKLRARYKAI